MSHDHHHHHQSHNYNRSFALGVLLNVLFVGVEVGYGLYANSMALIADAGHNLSDVFSLLLAWGATILAAKSATEMRTYGFRKATVLASLASAILLFIALGGIAWESLERLQNPAPVEGTVVMIVAGIGFVINSLTAMLFMRGQKHDLNLRGAFLHMAADAGVSLGVVVGGGLIAYSGLTVIDPILSLIVVAVVIIATWGLLRDSLNYSMDAVPEKIDTVGIKNYLMSQPQVSGLHDFHVWPLSTTEVALTVHLEVDETLLNNDFLLQLQQQLHDEFDVDHATIQVESTAMERYCLLDHS